MPTRNISLTREQDEFINDVVRSGDYQNASEAMRDAVRALQQRRNEDAARLRALRAELDRGIASLERGDYDEIRVEDLGAYLAKLGRRTPARPQKRSRKKSR